MSLADAGISPHLKGWYDVVTGRMSMSVYLLHPLCLFTPLPIKLSCYLFGTPHIWEQQDSGSPRALAVVGLPSLLVTSGAHLSLGGDGRGPSLIGQQGEACRNE